MHFPLAENLKSYGYLQGEDLVHSGFTIQITVLKGYHFTIIKMTGPKFKINRNHDLVITKICKTQGEVLRINAGLPRKEMDQE